ncbi:MAG: FAD-binding protein [Pseudomonadales bacterium]
MPAKIAVEEDWRFCDIPASRLSEHDYLLAVGNGRSYGDSCINENHAILSTRRLNRLVSFDREQGLLHCESGVLFKDILEIIVPQGWYLPVVPGTQLVTVGGAIANDIHGKNHVGQGTFGCHVAEITLLRSDGQRLICSAEAHADLFFATIGGLGLTGLIVAAKVRLLPIASGYMQVEVLPFATVQEYMQLTRESSSWPYTVAWVDCSRSKNVGRGLFTRGKFASNPRTSKPNTKSFRLAIPFQPPFGLVNRSSVTVFNKLYYAWELRKRRQTLWHETFFFPLDGVNHWNRIYGPNGFYQYQFVVPLEGAEEIIVQVIRQVAESGSGSFLAVLKDFGPIQSPGMLSFPREGLTLAVDVPNRGLATLNMLDKLDELILAGNGRLYPAKDARMPANVFQRQYPQWAVFEKLRDPMFSSTFWRRVTQ